MSAQSFNELAELHSDIPRFDLSSLSKHKSVSWMKGKSKRSTIPASSRKTVGSLDLILLIISSSVETSIE